jgi:hypothetical protein
VLADLYPKRLTDAEPARASEDEEHLFTRVTIYGKSGHDLG